MERKNERKSLQFIFIWRYYCVRWMHERWFLKTRLVVVYGVCIYVCVNRYAKYSNSECQARASHPNYQDAMNSVHNARGTVGLHLRPRRRDSRRELWTRGESSVTSDERLNMHILITIIWHCLTMSSQDYFAVHFKGSFAAELPDSAYRSTRVQTFFFKLGGLSSVRETVLGTLMK